MNKIILPDNLDEKMEMAVKNFWRTRDSQIKKQKKSVHHDQGNRGAVTGGKQMDGFVDLIRDILIMNGVGKNTIFSNSKLELPGYYRPNKKWDF